MNDKTRNILIVEDHPLIIEAYKSALDYLSINLNIKTAVNCGEGIAMINEFYNSKRNLDLVLLDIGLPPSKDKNILSGEDLGLKINTLLSETKIIISTTFNDNYRIHSILKSVNPDGFLVKSDITSKELIRAFKVVLSDPPYYSKAVIKLLRKGVVHDFLPDKIDRKILYELSIGTLTKDLSKILPLSKAGIEKRKRLLKQTLNIDTLNDRDLILAAKEKGFI